MKYDDRFAAMADAMLPGFTVENHQGLIVAYWNEGDIEDRWAYRGDCFQIPIFNHRVADKRKPPTFDDVSDAIESGLIRLRRDMHHFTPEWQERTQAMMDALPERFGGRVAA